MTLHSSQGLGAFGLRSKFERFIKTGRYLSMQLFATGWHVLVQVIFKVNGLQWQISVFSVRIASDGGKLSKDEMDAYQAPFPDEQHMAGVYMFPELVPTPSHDPTGRSQSEGGEANRAAWGVFMQWNKPTLLAFAPGDQILGNGHRIWQEKCPACFNKQNVDIIGGGHFLQDGCGNQLVQEINKFIKENPVSDKQETNYVIPKL